MWGSDLLKLFWGSVIEITAIAVVADVRFECAFIYSFVGSLSSWFLLLAGGESSELLQTLRIPACLRWRTEGTESIF